MKAIIFSLRSLRRDLKAGELRILTLALIIAVGAITTVSFFSDRIRLGMEKQASEMLAADLRLHGHAEVPTEWVEQARRLKLGVASTVHFSSVVFTDSESQLSQVKAVDSSYPLRGQLRTANDLFEADKPTTDTPRPGQVWVEPRLLQVLGISTGDKIWVGEKEFTVTRVIRYEPDRGGDLFRLAPRVLMSLEDVAATGLVQAGSRIHYHMLFAGEFSLVEKFSHQLSTQLTPGYRIETVREARPQMRSAMRRSERFLNLAALISALLAGVAIAAATQRYVTRHMDTSAIMRCLGATSNLILKIQLLQMLWLGILASIAGCLVGYLAQWLLADIMSGLFQIKLPLPGLRPALFGVLTGLIALTGFALPPVLRLSQVSPLRVFRKDIGLVPPSALAVYGSAVTAIGGLMLWHSRDFALTAYTLGGSLIALMVLAIFAYIAIRILNKLRNRVGVAWRFGLANIARRQQASLIQLVAIGSGIMVILLLAVVRADLLDAWQRDLPPDTPNHFLINIQPRQVEPLRQFLQQSVGVSANLFPMARARLHSVNDKQVKAEDYADVRTRRLATREFNLSWTHQPPANNAIIAGNWWSDNGASEFSVEEGIAETLGIKLGDELRFVGGGQEATGKVTNLRRVEWESFQVNFFVIASPGLLDQIPASFITSFLIPPEKRHLINTLVQKFPNITILDVDAILRQVRGIIDRVTLAVEFIFAFTLAAGLLVLYAAVQASLDERRYESGMLRAFGADSRRIAKGLMAEFALIGSLAGLLAGIAAGLIGWVLATQIFEISYQFNLWLIPVGAGSGFLIVTFVGLLGTRRSITETPLATLRRV